MYYFHKNIEQQQKTKTVSTLIRRTIINHWEQMAVYNLSAKSSYENDFLRSCDTEDWSNVAENITWINYI